MMNNGDTDIDAGRDRENKKRGDMQTPSRQSRWCERHGYFIDLDACEARAKTRLSCGRCIARWRQLSFPFMDS